jgi:hypothetical protein
VSKEPSQNNKNNIRENSRNDIVGNNTISALQAFCLFYRKGFSDVENPEEDKTDDRIHRCNAVTCHGNTDTRELINDNVTGVFPVVPEKVDAKYGKKNETSTEKDVAEY